MGAVPPTPTLRKPPEPNRTPLSQFFAFTDLLSPALTEYHPGRFGEPPQKPSVHFPLARRTRNRTSVGRPSGPPLVLVPSSSPVGPITGMRMTRVPLESRRTSRVRHCAAIIAGYTPLCHLALTRSRPSDTKTCESPYLTVTSIRQPRWVEFSGRANAAAVRCRFAHSVRPRTSRCAAFHTAFPLGCAVAQ